MAIKKEISVQEIENLEVETLDSILKGKEKKVKRLYQKVENVFQQGNAQTRSLIANKFIYPLSHLLEMNYSWGRAYLTILPKGLKSEYNRQIYSSGI
jgi:hypothetical protein